MTISKTTRIRFATMVFCLWCVGSVRAQVLSPEAVAAAPPSPGTLQAPVTDAAAEVSATPADEQTRGLWPTVAMPKLSMPKLTLPKLSMPSWPKNEDGIAKSPFTPISEGFKSGMESVSTGTQKAWQGTKNIFSFQGEKTAAKPAATTTNKSQQSLWDRLKGEQPEPDAPQTVAEWMSQPRINP